MMIARIALSFVTMKCLRNWEMARDNGFNGIDFCGTDLSEELGYGMG